MRSKQEILGQYDAAFNKNYTGLKLILELLLDIRGETEEKVEQTTDQSTDRDAIMERYYLTGSCTEPECKLCHEPMWNRKAGMLHSGWSPYQKEEEFRGL